MQRYCEKDGKVEYRYTRCNRSLFPFPSSAIQRWTRHILIFPCFETVVSSVVQLFQSLELVQQQNNEKFVTSCTGGSILKIQAQP